MYISHWYFTEVLVQYLDIEECSPVHFYPDIPGSHDATGFAFNFVFSFDGFINKQTWLQ